MAAAGDVEAWPSSFLPDSNTDPTVEQAARSATDPVERRMSEDVDPLKEAAEQTLNVILDLGLDGVVRWVSPSWADVVGTPAQLVQGQLISDMLLGDKNAFADAVESLKRDDSKSCIVRFAVRMGTGSKLLLPPPIQALPEPDTSHLAAPDDRQDVGVQPVAGGEPTLLLEGQGIMVHGRPSGGESHTMWMIRPPLPPREITIDLPSVLVDTLGVGAEMLAQYLTTLAEARATDPSHFPPPVPVLCRICERQIQPWWFEKHTDLCMQEHRAELEVQMAHENLVEHRHAIVRVLDALETRRSRPTSGDLAMAPPPAAEYKGLPIAQLSNASSGRSSGSASPAISLTRSRERSRTGWGPRRTRSLAARRPLARIVELVMDLCDTAIDLSASSVRDPLLTEEEVKAQLAQSESRIAQILQWQSPGTYTVEQDGGLALLCVDTERAARAKVDAVLRHRRIIEYAERIRVEYSVIVQDCVESAMRKAARLAAGEGSDSTDEADSSSPESDRPANARLPDEPTRHVPARRASDPARISLPAGPASLSSRPGSPGQISPGECPTPRSHRESTVAGTAETRQPSQASKRSSVYLDSEIGDSDSSIRSSIMSGRRRTESPASEHGLSRTSSGRERSRRSIVLPDVALARAHHSPEKDGVPASPLALSRLRLSSVQDAAPSPVTSPLLVSGEPYPAPAAPPPHHLAHPPPHHHRTRSRQHPQYHHRRQSSAVSTDLARAPISPSVTSVSQGQARAVAPSIKDFEIIKPISRGAFGSVYLAKKKSTGDYYAIKALRKADMVAKNQVTNVKAERAIMMRQGESDFVAKLYWTFASKDYLYLVMEYLNGGDVAALIKSLGGLPEDWAKRYVAEVVSCVEDLHKRGIVHRDLKPDNLLIDQKGHLKLTDFGLSRMGLIGRQKRVLDGREHDSVPDLLNHGPFVHPTSITSSRSTSFDLHGIPSASSTPQMTPDPAHMLGQPSYFSLGRDSLRRTSGYRSDSGGTESLHTMFTNFTLHEPGPFPHSPPNGRLAEEMRSEDGDGSPDLFPLSAADSHTSGPLARATPPPSTMMPPPMALFDQEDSTRRFVGTPDYLAPETVNGSGQDETSDWWSLGCILFELLYGSPPFHADSPEKVFANILQRKIGWPSDEDTPVSPEAKDIMDKLMWSDPRQRLGANADGTHASGGEEIKKHPWFDGVRWETLFEDEAQFIPAPAHAEDTEYFDARGASLQAFTEELADQASSSAVTPGADYVDRPHDALSKARSQIATLKKNLMPLHIPPHVRDGRSRRLSEPVPADDFGTFTFKNLPVLEKANKDVIRKLRAEAGQPHVRTSSLSNTSNAASAAPSQECSPTTSQAPLKRQPSHSGSARPLSYVESSPLHGSPHRASQPTSPLLVSFSTGQNHQRRNTSSTSSSFSIPSVTSLQPGNGFDVPRLSTATSLTSVASSPIKHAKGLVPAVPCPAKSAIGLPGDGRASRARSQTIGSQEAGSPARELLAQQKRRSAVFEASPSSSDTEESRNMALLRVQRKRQSSRRKSRNFLMDVPVFRPLDVLVVEDHPVSRLVMERLLEKLSCRTIAVGNGADAMRYATSEVKFDVIMMEINLPKINGADVARMIRDTKNANSHTPIVAVTGYLKELQDSHHFDALIEKPPTTSKLVATLEKTCQWRPAAAGYEPTPVVRAAPGSGLRQESMRFEDSPSSASSGFVHLPGGLFRGSSREESLSSSFFGDFESSATDDGPSVVGKMAMAEWGDGGLGIISPEEAPTSTGEAGLAASVPALVIPPPPSAPPLVPEHASSTTTTSKGPAKQRSIEKIRAKRELMMETKMHECGESGDDEDEELGDVQVRARGPPPARDYRSSKLGVEMMRTNSRGSVVSGPESELSFKDCVAEAPVEAGRTGGALAADGDGEGSPVVVVVGGGDGGEGDGDGRAAGPGPGPGPTVSVTPPREMFPRLSAGFDLEQTPRPLMTVVGSGLDEGEEEATPRAQSTAPPDREDGI
ncbi:MAG: rim15, signal transduction response regulator [Phylliscum demangeonii]|nr:MAG: rim15, signal transduction response regulator [Phylliscum demangeonii]